MKQFFIRLFFIFIFTAISCGLNFFTANAEITYADQVRAKVWEKLEGIYEGSKIIIKWEVPEVNYMTFFYGGKNNKLPPSKDQLIDCYFRMFRLLTGIKFTRVTKNPPENKGVTKNVIILAFTANIYQTFTQNKFLQFLFFENKPQEYQKYLTEFKKKQTLGLSSRLYYDKKKMPSYLNISELNLNKIHLSMVDIYSALTQIHLGTKISSKEIIIEIKKGQFTIAPFFQIFLKVLYRPTFKHGTFVKEALPKLTEAITQEILKHKLTI